MLCNSVHKLKNGLNGHNSLPTLESQFQQNGDSTNHSSSALSPCDLDTIQQSSCGTGYNNTFPRLSVYLPPGRVIQPSLIPVTGSENPIGPAQGGLVYLDGWGDSHSGGAATPANRANSFKIPHRDAHSLDQNVRERRRMNRLAEQKRRDALKTSLSELRMLVQKPDGIKDEQKKKTASPIHHSHSHTHTKSAIIRQTIEYIQNLRKRQNRVCRQREDLERANLVLQTCIEDKVLDDGRLQVLQAAGIDVRNIASTHSAMAP